MCVLCECDVLLPDCHLNSYLLGPLSLHSVRRQIYIWVGEDEVLVGEEIRLVMWNRLSGSVS